MSDDNDRQLVRVLLIEDDPSSARVTRRILEGAAGVDFQVQWDDRLAAGCDRLARGGVDVVLLDLMLPDGRGLDSLARVQAHRATTAVVVLSGLDDESLAIRAVQNGAQDYLLKGQFTEPLLVRSLRYAVERNRSQRRLAAQHAVTRILSEAATLADAAAPALRALGSELAWEVGNLWLVDRHARVLRCAESWHGPGPAAAEFDRVSRAKALPPGVGLPGRVWARGEPVWIADVSRDGGFTRAAVAEASGLGGAVGFPVRLGKDVLGVIEFFSRESRVPDAELIGMMTCVGDQIGQFVERKRSEAALRESEERLRVLFEQLPGVLWTTDTALRFTSSWGTGLGRASLMPGQAPGQSLAEYFGTDDPAFPPVAAHRRAAAGEPVSYELRWLGVTYQCHVEPLADRDGRAVGCIGVALDVTRYRQVEAALDETKLEMHLAGQIQRGFFPKAAPVVPGFDIAGASLPALTAGGDYYDFIPFAGGTMRVVIGDVSGHGLGPALLMASVRAHLHAIAATEADVSQILRRLNHFFYCDTLGDRFITIVLAHLDPATRSLVCVSAGHPTGYVLDRTGAVRERIESVGLPMGVEADGDFPAGPPITLEQGDVVLFLTDGVEETADPDGVFFGARNALEVVRACRDAPARVIVDEVHRAVAAFTQGRPQMDDVTTVVIKVL